MKHLNPKTKDLVIKSTKEQRIQYVCTVKWIGYSHAKIILNKLNELLIYPVSHRMPYLLIVGDSNNGKSTILNKFVNENPPIYNKEIESVERKVVLIQAPPKPKEGLLFDKLLECVYVPYKSNESISIKEKIVKHVYKKLNVKIILIDEFHQSFMSPSLNHRQFLNVLKYLSNELNISLVCAGTREAFNVIQNDSQLVNRFEPKILPRWQFDNYNEFLRLLASFEKILPLKEASKLIENSIAEKILIMSEGLIGEISKILELSTIKAIESGAEQITHEILDNIDFIPPLSRKINNLKRL